MIPFSENVITTFLSTLSRNKLFFKQFENVLKYFFYIFSTVNYG